MEVVERKPIRKEKSYLILLLYFQMRNKFTKVSFAAIRKTNYK